jgi:hypothetical protein
MKNESDNLDYAGGGRRIICPPRRLEPGLEVSIWGQDQPKSHTLCLDHVADASAQDNPTCPWLFLADHIFPRREVRFRSKSPPLSGAPRLRYSLRNAKSSILRCQERNRHLAVPEANFAFRGPTMPRSAQTSYLGYMAHKRKRRGMQMT